MKLAFRIRTLALRVKIMQKQVFDSTQFVT